MRSGPASLGGFGTIAHRAVLAAGAGADLLLCAEPNPDDNTPADGSQALQGLIAALADGQLSRASAEQAAALVIKLRASLVTSGASQKQSDAVVTGN